MCNYCSWAMVVIPSVVLLVGAMRQVLHFGVEVDDKTPPHEYYKYFGLDYTLHVAPSNMENKNSNQFLDEIRTKLLENLLRTCSQRSVSGTSTRERNLQRKTKIKKIQIQDMKNMIQTWKVDNCKPLSNSLQNPNVKRELIEAEPKDQNDKIFAFLANWRVVIFLGVVSRVEKTQIGQVARVGGNICY